MIPWFQYLSFNIGPLTIYAWGFFVALGFLTSFIILLKKSKEVGMDSESLTNLMLLIIVLGFLFARIFHIAFYEPSFFFSNPFEIFKVWNGGFSSFGGLFGAVLGFFIYGSSRSWNKEIYLKIADLLSFSAIFGWIVGRLGCFAIHDHLGQKVDFFLAINTPDGARLEMALLEILWLIPVAIIFLILRKKVKFGDGWFTIILLTEYGFMRFVLDFFRAVDIAHADVRYLGLTPAQYFAIILLISGIFLFYKINKKST
ncbi:MAG: prolipoprotein diacylglyceryl transferase [Candidatus Magasanikbacteria bacterium]|nr:prolipoprotein diacylglyceryl transferase [Candidatus Magasanikbacteria bacterium]